MLSYLVLVVVAHDLESRSINAVNSEKQRRRDYAPQQARQHAYTESPVIKLVCRPKINWVPNDIFLCGVLILNIFSKMYDVKYNISTLLACAEHCFECASSPE